MAAYRHSKKTKLFASRAIDFWCGLMSMSPTIDLAKLISAALPRFAEVPCADLDLLFPSVDDVTAFNVRSLFDSEIRTILALQDSSSLVALLRGALAKQSQPVDLDLIHRVAIVKTGCIRPNVTLFLAIEMACDYREALLRLSDKIMEITAQAAGFETLDALPRLH